MIKLPPVGGSEVELCEVTIAVGVLVKVLSMIVILPTACGPGLPVSICIPTVQLLTVMPYLVQ